MEKNYCAMRFVSVRAGFDDVGLDRKTREALGREMACRPDPLRVGRSLRDLYTPFGSGSRWSLGENLYADHREAQGEAGIRHEVVARRRLRLLR